MATTGKKKTKKKIVSRKSSSKKTVMKKRKSKALSKLDYSKGGTEVIPCHDPIIFTLRNKSNKARLANVFSLMQENESGIEFIDLREKMMYALLMKTCIGKSIAISGLRISNTNTSQFMNRVKCEKLEIPNKSESSRFLPFMVLSKSQFQSTIVDIPEFKMMIDGFQSFSTMIPPKSSLTICANVAATSNGITPDVSKVFSITQNAKLNRKELIVSITNKGNKKQTVNLFDAGKASLKKTSKDIVFNDEYIQMVNMFGGEESGHIFSFNAIRIFSADKKQLGNAIDLGTHRILPRISKNAFDYQTGITDLLVDEGKDCSMMGANPINIAVNAGTSVTYIFYTSTEHVEGKRIQSESILDGGLKVRVMDNIDNKNVVSGFIKNTSNKLMEYDLFNGITEGNDVFDLNENGLIVHQESLNFPFINRFNTIRIYTKNGLKDIENSMQLVSEHVNGQKMWAPFHPILNVSAFQFSQDFVDIIIPEKKIYNGKNDYKSGVRVFLNPKQELEYDLLFDLRGLNGSSTDTVFPNPCFAVCVENTTDKMKVANIFDFTKGWKDRLGSENYGLEKGIRISNPIGSNITYLEQMMELSCGFDKTIKQFRAYSENRNEGALYQEMGIYNKKPSEIALGNHLNPYQNCVNVIDVSHKIEISEGSKLTYNVRPKSRIVFYFLLESRNQKLILKNGHSGNGVKKTVKKMKNNKK